MPAKEPRQGLQMPPPLPTTPAPAGEPTILTAADCQAAWDAQCQAQQKQHWSPCTLGCGVPAKHQLHHFTVQMQKEITAFFEEFKGKTWDEMSPGVRSFS